MQNNGLSNKLKNNLVILGSITALLLLVIIISLFLIAGKMEEHNEVLSNLESFLVDIKHPENTQYIIRHIHFGDGSVSGSGFEACHYYVGEIRSYTDELGDISEYYKKQIGPLKDKYKNIDIETLPISEVSLVFGLDFPITRWIEEYLFDNRRSYILYIKMIDEDVSGDIRCWVI